MAAVATNHKLVLTCRLETNTPQSIEIIIIIVNHVTHEALEEPPTQVRWHQEVTAQEPFQSPPQKTCLRPKDAPAGIFVHSKYRTASTPKINN